MNQKDLKFPFKWEERRPFLHDKVFFVPKCYDQHSKELFPGWHDAQVFARSAPVWIEYCAGNGSWITEKAKLHRDCNWVAVEKKFSRVRKIWSKMKQWELDNLLIVCGEALSFTRHYVSSDSVAGTYINFPDPWPKGRHAKHRLIQEDFMTQMARICKKNAKATIVTDHPEYAERISKAVLVHPEWTHVFPEPYFITEWEGYGTSFFDQLWRDRGRTIHYMQFSKQA